jgi:curved DNA-binding protein CbpA
MRIFARINEANQVLSDPEKRREYDAQASDSGVSDEEQAQVQKVLRAATSFQKAQVLLKRNNLPGAEEAARLALADAPDEADHIALVAWLNATKQNADIEREFREVDRAVKLEPTNVRVRWYRGQLLKRLGKDRQALEDFRMIVEKDPRHVDAQREIRLYEMQRSQRRAGSEIPAGRSTDPGGPKTPPPGAPHKGGLLGKLFKK